MRKIYLSGPMSGFADYNFPAFHAAATRLRAKGYEVFNPAESFEGDTDLPWATYMRTDIDAIMDCDEVRLLSGWEQAVGARLEVAVALAIGLPVHDMDGIHIYTGLNPRDAVALLMGMHASPEAHASILEEATILVHGNRGEDYGHPYYDFRRTAGMWTGLFIDKLIPGESFTPRDVPLAMNCVKMSREVNRPKRDNRIDGAGYWETLEMVEQFQTDEGMGLL